MRIQVDGQRRGIVRSFLVVCLAVVAWSTSAWAMECSGWQRSDDDQKLAAIFDTYLLSCVQ
jgi:hypothetical protein